MISTMNRGTAEPWRTLPLDKVKCAQAIAFFAEQWTHPRGFEPDPAWLETYQTAYEQRPKPAPLVRTRARRSKAITITKASQLEIPWAEFFELIRSRERWELSNGNVIHVFDHPDGSYLQEIEACNAAFRAQPSLAAMPVDQRKYVAGTDPRSGYLGRMTVAGNFKLMIRTDPSALSAALDHIP